MKSVENTRRELFEAWDRKTFYESEHEQDGEGGYQDNIVNQCWMAFNAALDSVVIDLPPLNNSHVGGPDNEMGPSYEQIEGAGYNFALEDCRTAIESTNLGLKMK